MSRSNPTSNNPNPSTRWFEWHGSDGVINYWDKEKKERVQVKSPFSFFVLDILSTVKGWHEASESGIFANEVRDTKQDVLVVRSFKGGELASGIYQSIRDRVGNLGGYFVASIYIAYDTGDGRYAIGNLNLNGAALKAWSDFRSEKARGQVIFDKGCRIVGYTDGKKGSVKFRTPKFELFDGSEDAIRQAVELDKVLQEYLNAYMARPRTDAAADAKRRADLAHADAAAHEAEGGILGEAGRRSAANPEDAFADSEAERQARKAAGEFVDDDIADIPL